MSRSSYSGVWTALPTPYKQGNLDLEAFKRHISFVLDGGVHGLAPCGTTGEGSSLSDKEFATLVEHALAVSSGKVAVAPGTGSNHTQHVIERTRLAKELGATAALVVTPYYVKPNPDGLLRHFAAITDKCDLPLIAYNVPSRTGQNVEPALMERICQEAHIVAVKECAPLPQFTELCQRLSPKVSVLSGEDGLFLPSLAVGGQGVISVLANVFPKAWVEVFQHAEAGNLPQARERFLAYREWTDLLFVESNPVPLKYLLALKGLMSSEVRLPLGQISPSNAQTLERAWSAWKA